VQRFAGSAFCGEREKLSREVDTVHAKAGFCEKMSVASLTAGRVQNACIDRKSKHLDEPARLGAVALRGEDRSVFQKILRIEIALPPLRAARQKKTGSR
jgi:hypothetical protein